MAPGGTVHLLHFARGHIVAYDINAGSGLGVLDGEDDVAVGEREMVQDAVDQLAAAGVTVHGELINTTEHDGGPRSPNKSSGAIRTAPSCWPAPHN